ncbi:FLYWCH zinc finger domain protein [Trichuris suis]|nr:FLYWCH zinc finger domain protein [Trichuris suis]
MASIPSKRQREKMPHLGHCYCFDKLDVTGTVKFWRCHKRHSDDCKARIRTLVATGEVIKQVNQHTHGGDAAGVEVATLVTSVRRRAEETLETPAVILNEAYQGLSHAV